MANERPLHQRHTRHPDGRQWIRPARWRQFLVLGLLMCLPLVLLSRAVDLQVVNNDFLLAQGDARHVRTLPIAAHRGVIQDRHGAPLAISTPVQSLWTDPQRLLQHAEYIPQLAAALGKEPSELAAQIERRSQQEFMYLRRQADPRLVESVTALGVPGVHAADEYRRFYPAAEVTGHLLGFTNIDDQGLEGLELAFDGWLRGEPGARRVMRDRPGRVIADIEQIRPPEPGRDLVLSIDTTLQYLLHRELARAVAHHDALGGSAVLLDPRNGEVLAVSNQPDFNPNMIRAGVPANARRNRALIDAYEPGSTIKPFVVAAAMELDLIDASSAFDTSPGVMRVGRHRVRDLRDYGTLDVTEVISRSSNIGVTQIALALPDDAIWGLLRRVGLGVTHDTGFPGESAGMLSLLPPRDAVSQATLSFGYGLSVTPLQLAQAYAVFANQGVLMPPTLLRRDASEPGVPVLSPDVADAVLGMMEHAVGPNGTGRRAAVPGYRVAGKTGTSRKAVAGGYASDRYVSWFAGIVPANDPQLVMVVMLDEPTRNGRYGGEVAAPVFANVMQSAVRLLNIPPELHDTGDSIMAFGPHGLVDVEQP